MKLPLLNIRVRLNNLLREESKSNIQLKLRYLKPRNPKLPSLKPSKLLLMLNFWTERDGLHQRLLEVTQNALNIWLNIKWSLRNKGKLSPQSTWTTQEELILLLEPSLLLRRNYLFSEMLSRQKILPHKSKELILKWQSIPRLSKWRRKLLPPTK